MGIDYPVKSNKRVEPNNWVERSKMGFDKHNISNYGNEAGHY